MLASLFDPYINRNDAKGEPRCNLGARQHLLAPGGDDVMISLAT